MIPKPRQSSAQREPGPEPPQPPTPGRFLGCDCSLTATGVVLLALIALLAVLLIRRGTPFPSLPWLAVLALIIGMLALFLRFRAPR